MASAAYWRCPICLRRVPDKVAECYCGRKRQAGDGPDEGDAKGGGAGVWLALGVVAIAGLAVFALRRPPVPAAPTASPGAEVAPEAAAAGPESLPVAPARARNMPAFTGSSPDPGVKGATPAPLAPLEPRPSPTPEDSVDARREQGRLAFENAMRNLQGRADVLRRRLENLARTCPPEATRVIGCDGLRQEIAEDAEEIRTAAEQAEERARLGWVDPGAVREARERYGMREGDLQQLLARVNEALKR